MCGIVGLISRRSNGLFHKDMENFRGMLINDTQRGEDSTGAFLAETNGSALAVKVASNPFNLFATSQWATFQGKAISSGKFVVGHNRKATQGAVNSENAHPFMVDHIMMVHNGTLNNHRDWKTGHDVDSHALTQLIADEGYEAALKKVDGAFALVWYDMRDKVLRMVRNDKRPLGIIETDDLYAFASETWMPWGQLLRSGVKINKTYDVPEGVLFEFDLSGNLTTKEVEFYKPPPSVVKDYSGYNYRSPFYEDNERWRDDIDSTLVLDRPKTTETVVSVLESPWKDFKNGDKIQVKIHRIREERPNEPQPYRCYGSVMDYGRPTYDFVAWLPLGVKSMDWSKWMEGICTATILTMHTSTCGASIAGIDLKLDAVIQLHEGSIGRLTYSRIVANTPCTSCGDKIVFADHYFTSVNIKKSEARVHCHKCVAKSIPEGAVKDAFIKRRDAAVQARESKLQESEPETQQSTLFQGTTTIN